jgi:hypothetical protein
MVAVVRQQALHQSGRLVSHALTFEFSLYNK